MGFKSMRTTMFFLTLIAVLMPIIILSLLSNSIFENKIESIRQDNLMQNALLIQSSYERTQNDLLKAGILVSEKNLISTSDPERTKNQLKNLLAVKEIDIAAVLDAEGSVVASATTDERGFSHYINDIIIYSTQSNIPLVSTEIVPYQELNFEDESLLLHTETRRIPSINQEDKGEEYIKDGMAIVVVVPISENNTVTGSLLLVDVLNRDFRFPDSIKEITGLDVSIFQRDVRISTTAITQKDNRFIGTVLPAEIERRTLEEGRMFSGKVWVINKYAHAVYLPVKNFKGQVIGAIGFEDQEDDFMVERFLFIESDVSKIIIGITVLVILLSVVVTYFVTRKLIRPIHELRDSIGLVKEGNLDQGVKIASYEEINELAKAFNIMIRYLRKNIIKHEQEIIRAYQNHSKKKIE